MQVDGIHHISTMTSDGVAATEFVTGVLGLRLVAKTVNQDSPDMYHLFFTDEDASAGSDLTMFEIRGLTPGRSGAGMVHSIGLRVASPDALDFWQKRLDANALTSTREGDVLRFADPEGLGFHLVVDESDDRPLRARHPEIPEEVALRGFDGVHIFAPRPEHSAQVLTGVLGATQRDDASFELRSDVRGGLVTLDAPPEKRALQGAGTVHHVAFGVRDEDYEQWLPQIEDHGLRSSGLVDRHYFRSIYFREPGGVLYELATDGPGFEARTPREDWGRKIILPPWLEPQREQVEARLQHIPDPRADWTAATS